MPWRPAGAVLELPGDADREAHAAAGQGAEGEAVAEVVVELGVAGHAARVLGDAADKRALPEQVDRASRTLARRADRDEVAVGGDGLAEARILLRHGRASFPGGAAAPPYRTYTAPAPLCPPRGWSGCRRAGRRTGRG